MKFKVTLSWREHNGELTHKSFTIANSEHAVRACFQAMTSHYVEIMQEKKYENCSAERIDLDDKTLSMNLQT